MEGRRVEAARRLSAVSSSPVRLPSRGSACKSGGKQDARDCECTQGMLGTLSGVASNYSHVFPHKEGSGLEWRDSAIEPD